MPINHDLFLLYKDSILIKIKTLRSPNLKIHVNEFFFKLFVKLHG